MHLGGHFKMHIAQSWLSVQWSIPFLSILTGLKWLNTCLCFCCWRKQARSSGSSPFLFIMLSICNGMSSIAGFDFHSDLPWGQLQRCSGASPFPSPRRQCADLPPPPVTRIVVKWTRSSKRRVLLPNQMNFWKRGGGSSPIQKFMVQKQGFFEHNIVQNSNFRVQGMFFQQLKNQNKTHFGSLILKEHRPSYYERKGTKKMNILRSCWP